MNFLFTTITSYLLGSIPFGYLIVRIFRGDDVRKTGSGNTGATNVARTSPGLGIATLALDALKGFVAAALARHFHPEAATLWMALAALFAIVGHMFPIWLGWRGGKGVATALGAFLCLAPRAVLLMVIVFLLVVALFRYISLGSIVAALCFPVVFLVLEHPGTSALNLVFSACVLIIVAHHENIRRLMRGTENRFATGQK